jgi:L-fuconolactonase
MQKLIDSHIHFWDPSHLTYPWLNDTPTLKKQYLPQHLPASGDGWTMEKLVFVQCDCLDEQGRQEVDWVTSLSKRDKRIAGIVAFAPLQFDDNARPFLNHLRHNKLVKGIRRLIQSEALGFATAPRFVRGVQMLSDFGYSFDLCIRHHQMVDAIELVRQCRDVQFVLDHIGKPDIKAQLFDPWREQINTLAGFPNVMCKISGLVNEADQQNWKLEDLQPYIDHMIAAFGIDRVMFGGDYPVLELTSATYERWVETAIAATAALSETDKNKFFYENANKFYRLG